MKTNLTNNLLEIILQEGKTEEFKYDEKGNIIQSSYNGKVTHYRYDEKGNVTSQIDNAGTDNTKTYDIQNTYNNDGILVQVEINGVGNDYKDITKYDDHGRLIYNGLDETIEDWSKTISYNDEKKTSKIEIPTINYIAYNENHDLTDNQYIEIKNETSDIIKDNKKSGFELQVNNRNRETLSKYSTSQNNAVIIEKEYDDYDKVIKESEYVLKREKYIDYDQNRNVVNIDKYNVISRDDEYDVHGMDDFSRELYSSYKRNLEYDDQNRVIKSEVIEKEANDIPSTGWYKDDSITNLFDSYTNRFK